MSRNTDDATEESVTNLSAEEIQNLVEKWEQEDE
jgi:malonyl CoA-acyl carrier protein transacylase